MFTSMVDFVTSHWVEIGVVVMGFVMAFERLARLTPTKTDDRIVATAYRVFKVLGLSPDDNKGEKR